MISIKFPEPQFRIKQKDDDGDDAEIFDKIRKQWVALTPEEWVRQNFIQYLITVLNYPAALIAVEKELILGDIKKRFDILIYNKRYKPWMLIECKASEIPLDNKVLEQILRYHIAIPATYLVITNGIYTHAYEKKDGSLREMEILPAFG